MLPSGSPPPKMLREQQREALQATVFPLIADTFFIASFYTFYSFLTPTTLDSTPENPIWKFYLVLGISIGTRLLALYAKAYNISIANLPIRLIFGLMDYYLMTWISFPYHKSECEFNIKYGVMLIGFQQFYGFASIQIFLMLADILRKFETEDERRRYEDDSESEEGDI